MRKARWPQWQNSAYEPQNWTANAWAYATNATNVTAIDLNDLSYLSDEPEPASPAIADDSAVGWLRREVEEITALAAI